MSEESNGQLRDEALSRAYRLGAGAEPSPALDALVLAAARREVTTRPLPLPWWRRALAPVGVLATIVLTVSVTLMVEREQHEALPAAAPAAAPAPEQAPMSAEPTARLSGPADAKAKGEARRSAPAPAVAAPAGTLEGAVREPQAAKQLDSALDYRQNEAPAALSAPPPAMTPQSAPEAKKAEVAPPAAGAAAEPERSRAVMSATRRESAAADKSMRTPTDWIEEIRRLKHEGRETEMRAQLAAFRLAYPDYRLPDDLK